MDQRGMTTDTKTQAHSHQKVWRKIIVIVVLLGFIGLNGVSCMHAYRFTHVVDAGEKTTRPEELRLLEKVIVLLTGVKVPKTRNVHTPATFGVEYTRITIRDAAHLETPIWEIDSQQPQRTILLFHGFSSQKSALLPLGDLLRQHQCRVVLVDFPGHGDSPHNWTTLGHREADVVYAVLTHYAEHTHEPIILYGTSLGAAAIMTALHRYAVQPQGVILEMPYSSLYETVQHRFPLMGFPFSFPFAELLVFWGGVQHQFNAFALTPATFAPAITCPALVLGGQHDLRVPPEALEVMAAAMNGQARVHLFPNAGHESLFHVSPEDYERLLTEFFTEIET